MPRYGTDCTLAKEGKYKACSACPCDKYKVPKLDKPSVGLAPFQYVWGGQVRDARINSMAARPYFRR